MPKLFVYETLLRRSTRLKAMHGKDATRVEPGYVRNWTEIDRYVKGAKWPTVVEAEGFTLTGDILTLTPTELMELDRWEDHYARITVMAYAPNDDYIDGLPAFIDTYIYILNEKTFK